MKCETTTIDNSKVVPMFPQGVNTGLRVAA